MMNQDHQRPVTLEDLLRLKRAERPAPEFWNQFDHELRAKQLAALVEKRPWWRSVPDVFGSLSRYHLPLGATAILALTVLTIREYRSTAPQPVSASTADVVASVTSSVPAAKATPVEGGMVSAYPEASAPVADPEGSADSGNFVLASAATAPELSQMIPVLGAGAQSATAGTGASPAARFIAANLALAKAAEPAIAQSLLGASRGFEARAIPTRSPVVEPLSQMASPADVRRSRLLNGAVMSVSMNTVVPARSTEFRSRHISDEQLYDSISRFGAHGNSVLVKF